MLSGGCVMVVPLAVTCHRRPAYATRALCWAEGGGELEGDNGWADISWLLAVVLPSITFTAGKPK
jgi:hypothetical protein